jgi:hypothetical protein
MDGSLQSGSMERLELILAEQQLQDMEKISHLARLYNMFGSLFEWNLHMPPLLLTHSYLSIKRKEIIYEYCPLSELETKCADLA